MSKRGFTLIELLVVISIIGLLASIVLVSLNRVRMKARDARRKADLRQMRLALEMLYDDTNSYINGTENQCTDTSVGCSGCGCAGTPQFPNYGKWDPASDLLESLVSSYMPLLPLDPLNNSSYYYWFEPNADSQGSCTNDSWAISCEFYLCARLETSNRWYCNDSFGVGERW